MHVLEALKFSILATVGFPFLFPFHDTFLIRNPWGEKLVLCGHSLCGGVVAILGMMWMTRGPLGVGVSLCVATSGVRCVDLFDFLIQG